MVRTLAASDIEKKREMGACLIGCETRNTLASWCQCQVGFAAGFRYDCIATWGHHHAYHLSGQPWQCGRCPARLWGTQRQSCTGIVHDAVPPLLLLLLTNGNPKEASGHRQTDYLHCVIDND